MKKLKITLLICSAIFVLGCEKFLDKKPDQSLSTPSTLNDIQALLDNRSLRRAMNEPNSGSDEYFIADGIYDLLGERDRQMYIWDARDDDGQGLYGWYQQYNSIFNVNTVLENLDKIKITQAGERWDILRGAALFIRAHCFYQLAQVYTKPYDSSTASSDVGLCLRLTPDFNEVSVRASLKDTYDRIISDIEEAVVLLPNNPQHRTRPSKAAAYALLARVYLTMGKYIKSLESSDQALKIQNSLMEFNLLDSTSSNPIHPLNIEVLYYTETDAPISIYGYPFVFVDTSLVESYLENDLRKAIYLQLQPEGFYTYKAISNNGDMIYNGLSVDEVLLTKAECCARLGRSEEALENLNLLLQTRFKPGTYIPYHTTNSQQALSYVLTERRKELLNRGTRWADIRRLNREPIFAQTLMRKIGVDIYSIQPNDVRYIWLIPQEAIQLAGIPQNPR